MKFSVLGPGRWGSFIAWYLNSIKKDVTLWGKVSSESFQNLIKTHKNEYVTLPSEIELSTNLEKTVASSDYIIISINSQNLRSFVEEISKIDGYKNKKYILCMKGIEKQTGARLSTILIDFKVPKDNIAIWVGPGHIQAFVAGVPSLMLIDSYNSNLSTFLVKTLRSDLIRLYKGNDIIGSEIGAAAKNVMGIAAGILDGMNYSTLKGGLMARGTFEISKLIKACGGNELSAYGLCHLGDYEATLFSPYSHNRLWGESFVKGENFDKLAEGVETSTALLTLAEKYNVELPITKTVNEFINGKISKEKALKDLFSRENIFEF